MYMELPRPLLIIWQPYELERYSPIFLCLAMNDANPIIQFGRSRGITVNSVGPGLVETDIIPDDPGSWKMAVDPMLELTRAAYRIGTIEDIGDSVLLIVSEKARWIMAQHVSASGGITALWEVAVCAANRIRQTFDWYSLQRCGSVRLFRIRQACEPYLLVEYVRNRHCGIAPEKLSATSNLSLIELSSFLNASPIQKILPQNIQHFIPVKKSHLRCSSTHLVTVPLSLLTISGTQLMIPRVAVSSIHSF